MLQVKQDIQTGLIPVNFITNEEGRKEYHFIFPTPGLTITTDGSGFWSKTAKDVIIEDISVQVINSPMVDRYVTMEARFKPESWNEETDGLIYTDEAFLKGMAAYLISLGLSDKVSYTEHGMQGDDYVSMEGGPDLHDSFIALLDPKALPASAPAP